MGKGGIMGCGKGRSCGEGVDVERGRSELWGEGRGSGEEKKVMGRECG